MGNDESPIEGTDDGNERLMAALGYTGGDEEKARRMISGEYRDVRVIKGKFAVSEADLYGNFMMFAHPESGKFLNVSLIAYSEANHYNDIDIGIGWREYFKECERITRVVTLSDTADLLPYFMDSIEGYDLIGFMKSGDEEGALSSIIDIMGKYYTAGSADAVIAMEEASSLDLAEERIPVSRNERRRNDESVAQADTRPEIERNAQFVIDARAIVSPLNGKRVGDLKKGERMLLLLVNRDPISMKIADALGALDDKRRYIPMKGKIVDIVPVEKIGYYLYCAIAKNAIAKIPEEGNVLIEMADKPRVTIDEIEKKKIDRNLILYIALLAGLVAIAAAIIYVLV
jgi:hypothetical protein